ncbi:hypothetical protein RYX36_005853, partial [Vicia faba]
MGNCCSGGTDDPEEKGETDQQNNNANGDSSSATTPPSSKPSCQPSKSSKPAAMGPVLGRPMEDVKSTYSIGKELGRGQFGVTYLCTHKTTGKQ